MSAPLIPDDDTARDWLLQELSKPEYRPATPNPIDKFLNALWDWFASLFNLTPNGMPGLNPSWIFILVVLVLAVVLLVIFGRPRALAQHRKHPGTVFFDDDTRSARELRAAAETAAARGDWSLALIERFRAIARDLSDRTIIRMYPGTTAQGVATAASTAFPHAQHHLRAAAGEFDTTRYANRAATAADYQRMRELDTQLEQTRPQLAGEPVRTV